MMFGNKERDRRLDGLEESVRKLNNKVIDLEFGNRIQHEPAGFETLWYMIWKTENDPGVSLKDAVKLILKHLGIRTKYNPKQYEREASVSLELPEPTQKPKKKSK